MTQKERLAALRATQNPLNETLKNVQFLKGDTPVKGVDYYTEEEINSIISYIQSNVSDGKDGADGKDGVDGKDGIDGKDGKDGKPGKNGTTPTKGIDYWTNQDQASIISDVLKSIKVPKDGISPKIEDVVSLATKELSKTPFDIKKVLNDPQLRMLLRGGGLSSVAHDATLTGDGTLGNPLSVVAGSGTGTVTSVTSADANATVATTTTTPVITIVSAPKLQTARAINGVNFDGTAPITIADSTKVPTTTTVNGHALSANVTVTATDVGLGNVTNVAQLPLSYLDVDGTLAANSDTKVPSQKAVKAYADSLVVGLLDYRGAYNASGNTYPTTGGSGVAGAVMKGDMWVISVAGTLGGVAIQVGDSLIANIDTPGQTAANWNTLNANVSYVPEDVANKDTTTTLGVSDIKYPSQKAVKTYVDTGLSSKADTSSLANSKIATISFIIDGGGSAITTGLKGDLEIPFACTINAVTMLADQSGSVVVDIWKDTYANYPPTVAKTITASAIPTITTAVKSQDSTLTGWTTAVSAGDTLRFNVNSATTITRVLVSLKVTKS